MSGSRNGIHDGNGNGKTNGSSNGSSGRRKVDVDLDPAVVVDPLRPVLITGGAGFIGTNLAARYASAGQPVAIFDNLSRPGVRRNLEWLRARYPSLITPIVADVRDENAVRSAVAGACRVYHFAAQVAVTTSLVDPCDDFEINARGTLNVLEGVRRLRQPPPVLFTSTNKVYGDLVDLSLEERDKRYVPTLGGFCGVDESRPLNFHSPYGCSKGTADQYMLDYSRCYDLQVVVFRMSCIYGTHQCGNEDQGWVAHFLLSALRDDPIVIYGDGRQVRDILFVEDLTRAMTKVLDQAETTRGQAFNVGGGPSNSVSLIELLEEIEELTGRPVRTRFAEPRQGDQLHYVSDTRRLTRAIGWEPTTSHTEGVRRLFEWLRAQPTASLQAAASLS
jgi:CDP-paratose 2-epimerase